jgi:hypothetical protein
MNSVREGDSAAEPAVDGATTIEKFCAENGVGRTFVYGEIAAGRLIPKKAGRRTLIPRVEARRWLNALPNTCKKAKRGKP